MALRRRTSVMVVPEMMVAEKTLKFLKFINVSEITERSDVGARVGQKIKTVHKNSRIKFENFSENSSNPSSKTIVTTQPLSKSDITYRINEHLKLDEFSTNDDNRKLDSGDRFNQIRPFHSLALVFNTDPMPYLAEFCNLYANTGNSMRLTDRGLSQIKTDNLFLVGEVVQKCSTTSENATFDEMIHNETRKAVLEACLTSRISTTLVVSNDYLDLYNALISETCQHSKGVVLLRFSKFYNSGNFINQLKQNDVVKYDFLIGAEGAWNNDAEHFEAKRLSTKCKTVFVSDKVFRREPKKTIDTVYKMIDKIHNDGLKIVARENEVKYKHKNGYKSYKQLVFQDHDYNTESIPNLIISIDPSVFRNNPMWGNYVLEQISESSMKPHLIHLFDDGCESEHKTEFKRQILQSAAFGVVTRKRVVGDRHRKHQKYDGEFDSFFPSHKNVDVKFEVSK